MAVIQNQAGLEQSYGTIWMNTGGWTGVSFTLTTSFAEMTSLGTNFTLMTPNSDFSMTTDGRLKYTGIQTRNFIAKAYFMFSGAGTGSLAIYKNGSLITGSTAYSQTETMTTIGIQVSMATNDYLSVFVRNPAGTSTSVIYQITLTARSIF